MKFTPDGGAFLVHELVRMTAVAVHVTVAVRCSAVAEEEHHLMSALLAQSEEIPKSIRVLQALKNVRSTDKRIHLAMRDRIALL